MVFRLIAAIFCCGAAFSQHIPAPPTSGGLTGFTDSSNYATFALACTAAVNANKTLLISKTWSALPTQSCAAPIEVTWLGLLTPASGQVITLTGSVDAGRYRIFSIASGGSFVIGGNTDVVFPEWFGAVGDGSNDDTTALQAAINSRTAVGGVVHLGVNKNYKTSSALSISANGVQLLGYGFTSIANPGWTQITSTSATADIITMGGATANCSDLTAGLWTVVRGMRLNRSVTQSGTAKGINITNGCWTKIEDVESDQSISGFYVKGSANTQIINTQVNATGAATTKYGYEIDSTGTANSSTYLYHVVATGNAGTTTGLYLHGDCVADTYVSDLAVAGIANGVQITSTNGGAGFCNGDVKFFRPVIDIATNRGFVVTNVTGTTGYASIEIAGGHIDTAGAVVGLEIENSEGVNVHGTQFRSPSGTAILIHDSSRNLVVDNQIHFATLGVSLTGTSANNILYPNMYGASANVTTQYTNAGGAGNQFGIVTWSRCIIVGTDNGPALVDADLGPQTRLIFVPSATTAAEVTIAANAGTPNIQIRKNSAGTTTNLLSGVLATAASGGIACAKTATSQTCIDGVTTSSNSVTLSTTALAAGDWIELTSGTAGGTAAKMTVCLTGTVN
jgi:parallel beta-helix repeat protein